MKDLHDPVIDRFRMRTRQVYEVYGGFGDETCGAFDVPSLVDGKSLMVVASSDGGWEHVSVSRPNRTPTWGEMNQIKRLFWDDEQAVMQLHPPASTYVNFHPNCLHLWRPLAVPIPLPPKEFVG